MPNTFITPTMIARSALATLYNTIVLAGLVHRDYDADFSGKVGDTITVRVPAVFTAQEFDRTAGIDIQNATETDFDVELDTLLDVSFAVTAEDLTLELDDFETRLLTPAMEAHAQDIDGRLAEALIDQARASGYLESGTSAPRDAYRGARKVLGRNKIPLTNRYAVLSPEAVSEILDDDVLVKANESGSTEGLRNAQIGRIFGFDNYETQTIGFGSGTKGEADGIAFHRDAVTLVSRTLERPMGVAENQVAIESYKGLGLRVVKDYDINKKQDVVSVDILIGVTDVRANAAVELEFAQGS
jgi:hypothetical protein